MIESPGLRLLRRAYCISGDRLKKRFTMSLYFPLLLLSLLLLKWTTQPGVLSCLLLTNIYTKQTPLLVLVKVLIVLGLSDI